MPKKLGRTGAKLIHQFEGVELVAYKCPADKWTIGYGQTFIVLNGIKIPVSKGMEFESLKVAQEQFEFASEPFVQAVNDFVNVKLDQRQFDALVSFCYNVGVEAFRKSTLLKKINEEASPKDIDKEFNKWVYGNNRQRLPGLVARRKAESDHYFS